MRPAGWLRAAIRKVQGRRAARQKTPDDDAVFEFVSALRVEVRQLSDDLSSLTTQAAEAQHHLERLLAAERAEVANRASVAGIPRARLWSPSIVLDGRPVHRMHVRRLTVGEPVARSLKQHAGVTHCATDTADVRELWQRLLSFEEACGDVLRGHASTILGVPDATASVSESSALRVFVGGARRADGPVMAVPKFTYDCPPRKLYNFGHWLLDYMPQIAALSTIAPDAVFLLPDPCKEFQRTTLGLLGIERDQLVPWDGSPIHCGRLLVFESDGRTGGGRPLSALMEVRRVLASRAEDVPVRPWRRVYFSRRDARADRRWVTNEPDVEGLFQGRGFEIVSVASHPLEGLARIFREARVVAGVNGAGLAHILFSPAGAHVIMLFSDSLIRWHADADGARSSWAGGPRPTDHLATLGDSPRLYAHVAAAFDQVSHSFVGGDEMPIDRLAAFLDEVLEAVDRE
jgi:hypothetical protein